MGLCGEHIQELCTVYVTRFPESLREVNFCRKIPLQVTFRVWCLYSYLVHGTKSNCAGSQMHHQRPAGGRSASLTELQPWPEVSQTSESLGHGWMY
jgi:hypothetical protein